MIYSKQSAKAACELLGMEYEKTFPKIILMDVPAIVRREGVLVYLELPQQGAHLPLFERVDIEALVDLLNAANLEVHRINTKIEENRAKAKVVEDPLPPEPDCWNPWPDSAPPDGKECVVMFKWCVQPKVLIGKYYKEFSLWSFPTLDGKVQTFTSSDKSVSGVFYKLLNP